MLKTLKSKILAISIGVLAVIIFVFAAFAYGFEKNTLPLILDYYADYIEVLKDEINDDVIKIENNARGLALIGGLFYKIDKNTELTKDVIKQIFENYPNSLGGGIWFEPYVISKSQKRFCVYAFRDKNNNIVFDDRFNSEDYDYQNQNWYKQLVSQIKQKKDSVAWSLPYFEKEGSNTLMITAGAGIYDKNQNLVGISTVDWEIVSIEQQIKDMKFSKKGNLSTFASGVNIKNHFALFANYKDDYVITTTDPYLDNKTLIGKKLENIPWYSEKLRDSVPTPKTPFLRYHDKDYVVYPKKFDNGLLLLFCIPRKEIFYSLAYTLTRMIITLLLLGLLIPSLLYLSLSRYVMKPINKLIEIAHKIGKGEDVKIKLEKPEEFAQLASTFDKMTTDIKSITKERAKINSELSIAKSIQTSSLPSIFPPFPDKKEFDIFASMEPAKEVGGDFYDFFFINETKFMFLIADVSGKGVPAALFMMTVKTLVNNLAQADYSPKELMKIINNKIYETNKQGFFVTMLLGIVDVETGKMSLVNCGHNPPLLRKQGSNFEYLQLESNIVLGVFENVEFETYETVLNPGDIIYAYTDGVTESTNFDNQIYGEERLHDFLNNIVEPDTMLIAQKIKSSIQEYTNSAPQSDDITMLIFKYNGKQNDIKTFNKLAIPENYNSFYNWLHGVCGQWNLNSDLVNKLDMCAEEIFANIVFYAYPDKKGNIDVKFEKIGDNIVFEFIDEGLEYNPIEKPDPDIDLPPEQRPLGGLGIFMVKQMVDNITYKRENNKNILSLTFKV